MEKSNDTYPYWKVSISMDIDTFTIASEENVVRKICY